MGLNPTGDKYFQFEFYAPTLFQTAQRIHANEIKQNHSPVVLVVLIDPSND